MKSAQRAVADDDAVDCQHFCSKSVSHSAVSAAHLSNLGCTGLEVVINRPDRRGIHRGNQDFCGIYQNP
jgi:hypothetical protein